MAVTTPMASEGQLSGAPADWRHVRRVLAVCLAGPSDVLLLSPALHALQAALPAAELTLLVTPAGYPATQLLPGKYTILVQPVGWQAAGATGPLNGQNQAGLAGTLRARQFDAAIIFTEHAVSPYPVALACYQAGIPLRLGQAHESGGRVLAPRVPPPPESAHQIDRHLHLLERAGFPIASRQLELCVPAGVQAGVDARLQRLGVDPDLPFIVLAPGGASDSGAARRYTPERFAGVARLLVEHTGLAIVVVGRAAESELAAPILAATREAGVSLVGATSLLELAAVTRCASLVIANHALPALLADAFGRPTITLFPGTRAALRRRPRRALARLLGYHADCATCATGPCAQHLPALRLSPAQVAGEALDLLWQAAAELARNRLNLPDRYLV